MLGCVGVIAHGDTFQGVERCNRLGIDRHHPQWRSKRRRARGGDTLEGKTMSRTEDQHALELGAKPGQGLVGARCRLS